MQGSLCAIALSARLEAARLILFGKSEDLFPREHTEPSASGPRTDSHTQTHIH